MRNCDSVTLFWIVLKKYALLIPKKRHDFSCWRMASDFLSCRPLVGIPLFGLRHLVVYLHFVNSGQTTSKILLISLKHLNLNSPITHHTMTYWRKLCNHGSSNHAVSWKSDSIITKGYVHEKRQFSSTSSAISGVNQALIIKA